MAPNIRLASLLVGPFTFTYAHTNTHSDSNLFKTHPTAIHFAYDAPFCGEMFTFMPAISRSSIVTVDNELRHAATVPKLAAKILEFFN